MCFGYAAHAVVQWNVQWKIQVVGRGQSAGLHLERISAERLEGIRVCPEKAERHAVFVVVELAIPVSRELIVAEFARMAHDKSPGAHRGNTATRRRVEHLCNSGRTGYRGKQEAAGPASKLTALGVQNRQRHRIDLAGRNRQRRATR